MAINHFHNSEIFCQICSEYYTEPLVLSSCLHSFCKKCIVKSKDEQGDAEGSIKCPTCNTSTILPSGNVEDLAVNHWLAHKVQELKLREKINSEDTIPCSQCVYVSDEATAVSFCCECCSFLCELCQKVHKRRFHHELIELSAKKVYQDTNDMPSLPIVLNIIKRHYCQTCEELVCRDCTIVVKHKDHIIVDRMKKKIMHLHH